VKQKQERKKKRRRFVKFFLPTRRGITGRGVFCPESEETRAGREKKKEENGKDFHPGQGTEEKKGGKAECGCC